MGFLNWLFGGTIRPDQALGYLMEKFEVLDERSFAPLERQMPRHHPDRDLIYAVRVSAPIRRVTSLKTLASRWNTANFGSAASGLQMAKNSRNHGKTSSFLAERYLFHFRRIAQKAILDAMLKDMQGKRRGHADRIKKKIQESRFDFLYPIQGLDPLITEMEKM